MGRAKDELIRQQDKANHLDRCMKCNDVLRGNEERNTGVCEMCLKRAIEKD